MKKAQLIKILFLILTFIVIKGNCVQAQELDSKLEKTFKKATKLEKKHEYIEAIEKYKIILQKYPKHINTLLNVANIYYEKMRDNKNACEYYKVAYFNIKKEIEILKNQKSTKKIGKQIKDLAAIRNVCKRRMEKCGEISKPATLTGESPLRNYYNSLNYDNLILTGWITIKDINRDEKNKVIKNKVSGLYDSLADKNNDITLWEYDYNVIQKINNEWLKKNAFSNFEWISNLKKYENNYLSGFNEFNDTKRDIQKLESDASILKGDIKNINDKLFIEKQNKKRLQGIIDVSLKEEFNNKLATIPKSIVLIGRIKTDYIYEAELNLKQIRAKYIKHLNKQMQDAATLTINGFSVSATTIVENDYIKTVFAKTVQGTSQTTDTYYRDLNKTIPINSENKFIYLIQRIEVFPYNKPKSKNDTLLPGNETMLQFDDDLLGSIEVFEYLSKTGQLLNCKTKKQELYSHHKFKDQEKTYLDFQSEFSNTLNNKYQSNIDSAVNDYLSKLYALDTKIHKINTALRHLNSDKEKKTEKLVSINSIIKKGDETLNYKYDKCKEHYNTYQNYYKTKKGYTNKLLVEAEGSESISTKKHFELLIDKSFETINDLSANTSSITIYKELQNEGESYSQEKTQITFTPHVDAFQIISMSKYTDDEDSYVSLNIAYEISWDYKELDKIPVILSSTECPEITDEIIHDKNFKINFKIIGRPSSYLGYIDDYFNNDGWRLPTLKELEKILSSAKALEGKDCDLFVNYFSWPRNNNEIVFLSNDSFFNDYNERMHQGYSVRKSDYNYKEENDIDDGGLVYLIIIKN